MRSVVIIDYGMGNLDSVVRACEECGAAAKVSSDRREIEKAEFLILPGVGAFNIGMQHLHDRGLVELLNEQVIRLRVPTLGICLGMQLLSSKGWEGGETPGLGWIPGEVRRLEATNARERIPHVGWNEVHPRGACSVLAGIKPGTDFYFVHSYHFRCSDAAHVAAVTPYCGETTAIVARDNVWGVQFHPEKSQKPGFQVLRNYFNL